MEKYVIGVDVGGTEVKLGLFCGHLLESWRMPTNKEAEGSRILPEIAGSVGEKCRRLGIAPSDILGIGIGVPGPVIKSRIVLGCVNLGWGDVDVADVLARHMASELGQRPEDYTVRVANDANMAALGEMWQGSGKNCSSLVMVTLGTGVGGGIVIDGKIFDGSGGSAGEIGHIHCVDEEDTVGRCTCGRWGCLEQIASARGIGAYAEKYIKDSKADSCLREKLAEQGFLTAKDVADGGKAGDAAADAIMDRVALYLGRGIAAVCAVVNPERILVGGGVSAAGEYFRSKIEAAFRQQVFPVMKETPVELAKLGNQAGITGSIYRIISEFK